MIHSIFQPTNYFTFFSEHFELCCFYCLAGTVGETQGVNEMGAVGEEGAVREAEAAGKTEATGKQEEAKGADTVKDADMNLEQTEENKLKAEALKTEGNEAIRAEQFLVAIEKYSAAIALDPRNAVYFCNRAAAYTRLNRYGFNCCLKNFPLVW